MHLHLTLQPGSWPPQARRRIPCHRLPTRSTHTHTHSFSSRTCSFHPAAAPGVIEYWSASTYRQPEEEVQFRFKLDTGGWGSGGCLAAWPATAGMACLAWPGSLPGSLLLGLPCACLLDWCGACLACRKTPMTPCILLSFLHSLLHSVFPFHHLPLLFSSLPTPPLQTCTLWPRPRPPPTRWPSPVTGPSLPPCRQTGGAGLHAPFVCGGGGGGGGDLLAARSVPKQPLSPACLGSDSRHPARHGTVHSAMCSSSGRCASAPQSGSAIHSSVHVFGRPAPQEGACVPVCHRQAEPHV